MKERPTRAFNNAREGHKPETQSNDKSNETEQARIRDQDNADHAPKPPRLTPFGPDNRAPRGMKGIQRNMPTKDTEKAKLFTIKEPGDLKRTFKPIARGNDKDRGHER